MPQVACSICRDVITRSRVRNNSDRIASTSFAIVRTEPDARRIEFSTFLIESVVEGVGLVVVVLML